ncbi:hemophore-related protein [Nocardia stercoris]|uniref:Hemophore-related protein n=1 Tax=Nocardia stercoris TaxID=2483361 RepID=A0A3M2LGF8_9NOCA|nr:hemophore-related protein [Nocardia stercoris]RMI35035.1 hemophore-related protein [Nocardia stercoris]
MKRTVAAVLTGTAVTAGILAVALPSAASADPLPCSPQSWAQVKADTAPKVQAYIAANPALQQEIGKLRGLPKDQRKAERQAFAAANPDLVAGLKAARQEAIDYRHACHPGK